jgi:hypothetical protein
MGLYGHARRCITRKGSEVRVLYGPASNGGPTQTVKPLTGNPAIGLIPNPTTNMCPTIDQRGVASPNRGKCNSGSVQPG